MRRLITGCLMVSLLTLGEGLTVAQESSSPPLEARVALTDISTAVHSTLAMGTAEVVMQVLVSGFPSLPGDTVIVDGSGQISSAQYRAGA